MKSIIETNTIRILGKIAFLAIVLQLAACASKAHKDESNISQVDSSPAILSPVISSQPLDFNIHGSDSQKIQGLSTLHFAFDKSVILKSELLLLDKDAAWIKAHPNLKVQIEGNCDSRGSVEYNLALGDRRAKVIYNSLVEMGVDRARLSTISYGKERPLVQGDTEEAYAQNRRANFVPLNAPATSLSSND